MFDDKTNIIRNLSVINQTDDTITISWLYDGEADGFNIIPRTERPYPDFPMNTTKAKQFELALPPGITCHIQVSTKYFGLSNINKLQFKHCCSIF